MGLGCGTPTSFMPADAAWTVQGLTITPEFKLGLIIEIQYFSHSLTDSFSTYLLFWEDLGGSDKD